MASSLNVPDFLHAARHTAVVDVRSPGEYARAHIPGAVNIPLFDNDERARVGTCYKQVGKEEAVLMGLDIVGPKLGNFVREAQGLGRQVLVHCWRGGMRSGSMAWLFETAGLQVSTLKGGYKAYRAYVGEAWQGSQPIVVLGGLTGSGKTPTLRALAELGEQVIDLEALACHRGSAFGMLGQAPQPSSEMFENLLFEEWQRLDPTRPVWLEDESRMIGSCYLPEQLWRRMQDAPLVYLEVPLEARVEELVKDYGQYPRALLAEALGRIKKRLGGQHYQAALDDLERGDYALVARRSLVYYDKSYQLGLSKKQAHQLHYLKATSTHAPTNARLLKQWSADYFKAPTP